ncbi:hypothetical protein ACH5RR_036506 [Cinchona calisaya]|uniref:Uncharacterized protein n=1 Tax=Cinchona calisaya TaxID=153742 RepID=A0ABD2Y6K5_9GENT
MGEISDAGIQVNDEFIVNVDEEMKRWDRKSIYKRPACVTNLNENAYKPQVVSFGPYHYNDDKLKSMEEHKRRALAHFLERSKKPLPSYISSLREIVQDVKDAYDPLPPEWNEKTDEFLELMIWDGCFMLEILRTSILSMRDYARNDPIFSNHGRVYIMPYIQRDMLMLENQIPLSVLEKLLKVENEESPQKNKDFISRLILQFYHLDTNIKPEGKSLHVLDVFRKSMLQGADPSSKPKILNQLLSSCFGMQQPLRKPPPEAYPSSKSKILNQLSSCFGTKQPGLDSKDEIVRSATELNEAGIKIEKSTTKCLKDITFDRGILKLPPIVVDDVTGTTFLNLIAFERFHVGAGNEVTAYVFFMDSIINDSEDVKLLHSGGIIQNALGSDKAVADLFNSLLKDGTLDPDSSLNKVHNMVTSYCKNPWPRWRANLSQTYFTNPWAFISFIAAIFLFALTTTQTGYSISDYYRG